MMKKILFLTTALALTAPSLAGLPEALMSFDYQQYQTAFNEFQDLARQGNASALYYLGRMYQDGMGVSKNAAVAVDYFKKADQAFYLPAATQLGKIYLYGTDDFSAQPKLAIPLLQKAALAGDAEAAFELGNAAMSGVNDDINYNHAFGFYHLASLKGDMKAQFQLSRMYLQGRGIPQNHEKAMIWLSRSANQGYVRAQMEAAYQFENNPKLKNIGLAYSWNSILAAYNFDEVGLNAAKKRDQLALKIKPKELNQYQDNVRSWTPKNPKQSVPEEERKKTPTPVIPGFNDPKTLQQILLQTGTLPQDMQQYGLTTEMLDMAEATQELLPITNAIEKAFKRDNLKAAAFYGDLLLKRFNNPQEAVKWYQKGAEAGDPYAQYQYARSFCEGWAETLDAAQCYAWLLISSEAVDPVLNGILQQAILMVRTNATEDEIQRGQAKAEKLKKDHSQKEHKKDIMSFF